MATGSEIQAEVDILSTRARKKWNQLDKDRSKTLEVGPSNQG